MLIIHLVIQVTLESIEIHNRWTKVGNKIEREPNKDGQFGYSVSISNNGRVVAIGSSIKLVLIIVQGHVGIYELTDDTSSSTTTTTAGSTTTTAGATTTTAGNSIQRLVKIILKQY